MGLSRRVILAGLITALPASAAAASYRQQFPFPRPAVFQALLDSLTAQGLKIREQDAVIYRVTAAAGVSAFSWGENMSIAVVEDGQGGSVLEFDSKRVLGTNVADGGRSLKLFNRIVMDVSRRLQLAASATPAPTP